MSSPELSHDLCTVCGDNFRGRVRRRTVAGWLRVLVLGVAVAGSPAWVAARAVVPLAVVPTVPALRLAGTRWQLIEFRGQPLALPQPLTLAFGQHGLLEGHTGCNRLAGEYLQKAEQLHIRALRHTMQPCPSAELSRRERDFLAVLAGSRTIALNAQGHLVVFSTAGTLKAQRLWPLAQALRRSQG